MPGGRGDVRQAAEVSERGSGILDSLDILEHVGRHLRARRNDRGEVLGDGGDVGGEGRVIPTLRRLSATETDGYARSAEGRTLPQLGVDRRQELFIPAGGDGAAGECGT